MKKYRVQLIESSTFRIIEAYQIEIHKGCIVFYNRNDEVIHCYPAKKTIVNEVID